MAAPRKDSKKRALYQGEFERPNGTYEYRYTDSAGKRKSLYAETLEKLREKEKAHKRDVLDGIDTYMAGEATLNFLFERYISNRPDLRARTKENYKLMYKRYVKDIIGSRKVADLKFSDMVYFYQYLLKDKGMLLNSVKGVHNIVHPVLEMAVRDDIIAENPANGAMVSASQKPGRNHGVRHALTLEQQRSFMKYVKENPKYRHWLPLFTVMLGTGMRVGEVVGLRWQDIDLETYRIDVNHSLVYYAEEGAETTKSVMHVSMPKTQAGIRIIPMMPQVHEAFVEEAEAQKKTGSCIRVVDGMDGFIFCNRFHDVQNPQTINRTIKRIVADHNADELIQAKKEHREPVILPVFSCHVFRHTFCTRFCEHEDDLKVIQMIMGHADIETTMDVYAEITDMRKQEAFKVATAKGDIF